MNKKNIFWKGLNNIMLKLTILEFFLRVIPESLLFVLGIYLFANKSIDKKPYLISSMLFSISVYLVRRLPIVYGVHTIIIIMLYILILISINKIPVSKAISFSLILIIMVDIFEWLNLFVLNNLLKIRVEIIVNNPLMKIIYFTPSLVLFGCGIILFYVLIYKIKVLKQ